MAIIRSWKETMPKLRITALHNEWPEDGGAERVHDEVIEQVADALVVGGHEVMLLGIYNDLRRLIDGLEEQKPDLVFNLCEGFGEGDIYEMGVAAVLEMIGQRFTGTGSMSMALRQDKAVTKKLLAFHDVRAPQFATFDTDRLEFAAKMRFPLLIKPLHGDASLGVDDGALVRNYSSLVERINYIHTQLRDTALVEEYIEGREFYVTILGNDPAEALPLIELDFSKLPDPYPHIYGREAKFEEGSVQYHSTNAVVATDLPPEVRNRIIMAGVEAAHALQVSDYARVDIRLAPDGRPYVVEVNANPYLERTGAVAVAALQAGMAYSTLINRIVDTAWRRWEASEPPKEEDEIHISKRTKRGRPAERADHEGEEKEAEELLKVAG